MAIEDYTVNFSRTELIEVTVTTALEAAIWADIEDGMLPSDIAREEYEQMGDEGKARFLAKLALDACCAEFIESDGERLSIFEAYPTADLL